jgi:hypothetical protein
MSLSEDVLIEILKKLPVNDLVKLKQCNIYYNQLIINNKILVHNLINEYKDEKEDELVDILITVMGDHYIMYLIEAFLIIYPKIIENNIFISVVLEYLSLPILQYLLDHGLNPNMDIYGYSLLESLIRNYNRDPHSEELTHDYYLMCELLLKNGANPDAYIDDKNTIIYHINYCLLFKLFLSYIIL